MKKLLTIVVLAITTCFAISAKSTEPNSVIKYKADEILGISQEAFNCPILTHEYDQTTKEGVIIFKGALTKITGEAFYSPAEWILFPESLVDISEYAFGFDGFCSEFRGKFAAENGCCLIVNGKLLQYSGERELENYTVPNGVTRICQGAFRYTAFGSITIPQSVTEIHGSAFNGACKKLTMLSSKAPKIYGGELHDTEGTDRAVFTTKVYVPKGAAANYKSAPYWKNVKEVIFEY